MQAFAGAEPYLYSVLPGGIGGSISADGIYTAPASIGVDTIQAVDDLGEIATFKVYVGTPLHLVGDIVRKYMGLDEDQVYLYNQKYKIPPDQRIYIAISQLTSRAFGSSSKTVNGIETIAANIISPIDITIQSRSMDALLRKEEIILALDSEYARRQQELNGFYIGKLSANIVPLNQEEGAAIPYMFNLTVNLQYSYRKSNNSLYFDDFENTLITNP